VKAVAVVVVVGTVTATAAEARARGSEEGLEEIVYSNDWQYIQVNRNRIPTNRFRNLACSTLRHLRRSRDMRRHGCRNWTSSRPVEGAEAGKGMERRQLVARAKGKREAETGKVVKTAQME